jgi:ribosomal protein L37AE/L43A
MRYLKDGPIGPNIGNQKKFREGYDQINWNDDKECKHTGANVLHITKMVEGEIINVWKCQDCGAIWADTGGLVSNV